MFIYNKVDIEKIATAGKSNSNPSLAVTNRGRLFLSYQTERAVFAISSEDGGISWSAPLAAVAVGEGETVFDSRLWVDPENRLWFMWSVLGENRAECAICSDADADTLEWGEARTLDFGLMLSRPLVATDGSWLFLSGVTKKELDARGKAEGKARGLYFYETRDRGETFSLRSKPFANTMSFEAITAVEKVLYSRPNGVDIESKSFYTVYAQVAYGLAKLVSPDGGVGFRAEADSTFGSYFSQFDVMNIGPLDEKGFVLVNNMRFAEGGKMCLCALVSNNRGDSYQGVLELESPDVGAYSPDIAYFEGTIYVAYARDVANGRREIAIAKFTKQDAHSFGLTEASSYLGRAVV